jgi:hypothetical protein
MTVTDMVCGLCIFGWAATIIVTWVWLVIRGNQ